MSIVNTDETRQKELTGNKQIHKYILNKQWNKALKHQISLENSM